MCPFIFNGTTITKVYMNGVEMDSVYMNGVEVFSAGLVIVPGTYTSSSADDSGSFSVADMAQIIAAGVLNRITEVWVSTNDGSVYVMQAGSYMNGFSRTVSTATALQYESGEGSVLNFLINGNWNLDDYTLWYDEFEITPQNGTDIRVVIT